MSSTLLLLIVFLVPAWGAHAGQFEKGEAVVITKTGRYRIAVELATTPAQREQGLQHRQSLAIGTGMLFDFGVAGAVAMWMKNTRIPLDMLFVGEDGVILNIARNTVPFSLHSIRSRGAARWVLEINAGGAARMKIAAGDRLLVSGQ